MPRKVKTSGPERPDLRGTWFQCEQNHLVENPIFLDSFAYCDREDCVSKCRIVHSAWDDKEKVEERRRSWNSGINPSIGKLVKQIEEEKPKDEEEVPAEIEAVEDEDEEAVEGVEDPPDEAEGEESESP